MRARVASAGTGKTTNLVKRYLELIEEGRPLRRVAGVTFTRSAAEELRQRVAAGLRDVLQDGSYLGDLHRPGPGGLEPYRRAATELGGVTITTIHGFMRAALRLNAPLLGLDPNFTMLAEWEAASLFEEELASVRLLAADPDHPLHRALLIVGDDLYPLAGSLFSKRSLAADLEFPDEPLSAALGQLFQEAYGRLLRRLGGGAMGPGEVERAALRLFSAATMRGRLARRYPVVLVDEFQDVNPLQGLFFERLAAAGVALEVVGDPKQSIYGFRSADIGVFRRALDAAEASGGLLEPLRHSRRHSRAIVAFLNHLTTHLARQRLGFEPREAPAVAAAGSQANVAGSVRLLVAQGDAALSSMRPFEAAMLSGALREIHEHDGVSYDDMAVVARSNWLLNLIQGALSDQGIPNLILRGSGLFDRLEVRDVRHALQVGVEPRGPSLAPFLRGPYAAVALGDLAAVMGAGDPVAELESRRPDVAATVAELGKIARLGALDALSEAVRAPLIGGRRYVDLLDDEARGNVDGMLFELAQFPPGDLELLLARLDDLAERSEAAAVPSGGSGVKLSTIHASKGLEYPVVALFDVGAGYRDRPEQVLVDPDSGLVSLRAAGTDQEAQNQRRERDLHESFRLLYVAASRARDTLLLSGSASFQKPRGWLEQLLAMGLEGETALPGTELVRVPWQETQAVAESRVAPRAGLPAAPWTSLSFGAHRHPPLSSPSRLVGLGLTSEPQEGVGDPGVAAELHAQAVESEPLTWVESLSSGDADAAGEFAESADDDQQAASLTGESRPGLAGRGRVVGTLVHFAISRDWSPEDEAVAGLRTQEVMFPYETAQQDELLAEVKALLAGYHKLLGDSLPPVAQRLVDRAEIPLAYPGGTTVWEGVIDRLYQTAEGWFIDDYKTDVVVRPERYLVQLGLYRNAVSGALGAAPRARLVYLRSGSIVEPDVAELEAALERSGIAAAGSRL